MLLDLRTGKLVSDQLLKQDRAERVCKVVELV